MCKSKIKCLNMYFAPDETVMYLYHYTTVEALINGIVCASPQNGEELCLRATHNQYMNDPTEFQKGMHLLDEMCKKIRDLYGISTSEVNIEEYKENFYFVCFSENADSLPMWCMYGNNGHGIALKFRRFEQTVDTEWILKCEYDCNHVLPRFSELQKENETMMITYLSLMPFILKDPAYIHEKETRFVGSFPNVPTKYRYRNGMVIPYKEIFVDKEVLESIVIGPSANQEDVKRSLRRFLDDNNLQHVNLERSSIPYRS